MHIHFHKRPPAAHPGIFKIPHNMIRDRKAPALIQGYQLIKAGTLSLLQPLHQFIFFLHLHSQSLFRSLWRMIRSYCSGLSNFAFSSRSLKRALRLCNIFSKASGLPRAGALIFVFAESEFAARFFHTLGVLALNTQASSGRSCAFSSIICLNLSGFCSLSLSNASLSTSYLYCLTIAPQTQAPLIPSARKRSGERGLSISKGKRRDNSKNQKHNKAICFPHHFTPCIAPFYRIRR